MKWFGSTVGNPQKWLPIHLLDPQNNTGVWNALLDSDCNSDKGT